MAAAIVAAAMMLSIATPDPTPSPSRWHTSVYARANQITMDGAGNNSFAKPTAFQGADAKYVAGDWTFETADVLRFESRDAQSFTRTTLLTDARMPVKGFMYARVSYAPANHPFTANAYVYRMSDLETLSWFTGKATLNPRGWAPYVAAQGGFENNLGAPTRNLNVEAAFDVNRGAWLSPYTDGYTSDPWYTSPLLDGMVDRHAAGSSSILDATYTSNDKRLSLLAFDAWYDSVREIDAVVFYRWSRIFLRSGLAQELKPSGNSRHLFLQLEYSSEGKF